VTVDDPAARCPRCATCWPGAVQHEATACAGCSGIFYGRAALEARLAEARGGSARGSYVRPFLNLSEPIRYLPCPVCRELMTRRNFGEESGVVVDICQPHGVWFDAGELDKVLEFCSTGAFERAASRSAERRSSQDRAKDFARRLETQSGGDLHAADPAMSTSYWLVELCLDLLLRL
jgi:Zn-finger nucleic acid-binding protein